MFAISYRLILWDLDFSIFLGLRTLCNEIHDSLTIKFYLRCLSVFVDHSLPSPSHQPQSSPIMLKRRFGMPKLISERLKPFLIQGSVDFFNSTNGCYVFSTEIACKSFLDPPSW